MARRRLLNFHSVIHGATQMTGYTHQCPSAMQIAKSTACTATMHHASRLRDFTARQRPVMFFEPETKNMSRVSLRRIESGEIG